MLVQSFASVPNSVIATSFHFTRFNTRLSKQVSKSVKPKKWQSPWPKSS